MFKNLRKTATATQGLYAKIYKSKAFVYIDGVLVNEEYEIIAADVSLTKAAKIITQYQTINGKSWWKKIEVDELTDEARAQLERMGLLNESHQ